MIRIFFFILISTAFLGCINHNVDPEILVKDMKNIQKNSRNANINLLWYKGSDSSFHYFAYVYSMTGTKHYKVLKEKLVIKQTFDLTDDSTKWSSVKNIDDVWFSSYKDNDIWIEEKKGISIFFLRDDVMRRNSY